MILAVNKSLNFRQIGQMTTKLAVLKLIRLKGTFADI